MTVSLLTNITGVNLSLSLKTYEIGVVHIHSILMHYLMCLSILQFSCYNKEFTKVLLVMLFSLRHV